MFNKISRLGSLFLMLLLAACRNDVTISTTLNNTRDVAEGASVYLDEKVVGEVIDVDHAAGQTVLKIELDEAAGAAVKQNAAVVINRLKANTPIEIYNQKAAAESVQDGQELKGLDSMFQLGAWMVGDSLDMGADTLTGYVSAFQKYLQGDDWQQDKSQIAEQAQQVATAAEAVVKQASEEVVKMTQDLQQVEGEVAAAVEQISGDLAPVFGELAKSGQTIMHELEKLSHNLEQQGDAEQAVGTQFMQSLEQALETLNDSMEQTLPGASSDSVPEIPSEAVPNVQPGSSLKSVVPVATGLSVTAELGSVDVPANNLVNDTTIDNSRDAESGHDNHVNADDAAVLPPVVPTDFQVVDVPVNAQLKVDPVVASELPLKPEVNQDLEQVQQVEQIVTDAVQKPAASKLNVGAKTEGVVDESFEDEINQLIKEVNESDASKLIQK